MQRRNGLYVALAASILLLIASWAPKRGGDAVRDPPEIVAERPPVLSPRDLLLDDAILPRGWLRSRVLRYSRAFDPRTRPVTGGTCSQEAVLYPIRYFEHLKSLEDTPIYVDGQGRAGYLPVRLRIRVSKAPVPLTDLRLLSMRPPEVDAPCMVCGLPMDECSGMAEDLEPRTHVVSYGGWSVRIDTRGGRGMDADLPRAIGEIVVARIASKKS